MSSSAPAQGLPLCSCSPPGLRRGPAETISDLIANMAQALGIANQPRGDAIQSRPHFVIILTCGRARHAACVPGPRAPGATRGPECFTRLGALRLASPQSGLSGHPGPPVVPRLLLRPDALGCLMAQESGEPPQTLAVAQGTSAARPERLGGGPVRLEDRLAPINFCPLHSR